MLKEFRIYKPFKDKTTGQFKGAASKIELRRKDVEKVDAEGKKYTVYEWMMFWTGTVQKGEDDKGNASFDWQTKEKPGKQVCLKLGDPDVGDLLAVLNGQKPQVGGMAGKGIYHENDKGNSSLTFKYNDGKVDDGKGNMVQKYEPSYRLRVSSKVGSTLIAAEHSITLGEAEILKEILLGYVRKKYLQ